jgi:hypothetical protein
MYNFFKKLFIFFASFTICFVLLGAYISYSFIYAITFLIRKFKKTIKNTINATKSIF